jgi:hypothetical protein
MLYNININQYAIIENGWDDMDIRHAALFGVIHTIMTLPDTPKIEDENGVWCWVDHNLILSECQILGIKTKSDIEKLFEPLFKNGLLEVNTSNDKVSKGLIRPGRNSHLMFQNNKSK